MRRLLTAFFCALLAWTPAAAQVMKLHPAPAATGCAYSTEACNLFAVMTSAPDATRKGLIDTAIVCLQSAGVWTKEDWLVVMAAGDQHDGLLNWIAPSTKTLSAAGSFAFVTDRGFTTTHSTSNPNPNYLLMPELLNAAGNVYAQDDAHFSGYFNVFDFQGFGGLITDGGTNYNSSLGQYDGTNSFFGGINNGTPSAPTTGVDATASHFQGMWTASRSGSTTATLYKTGSPVNGVSSWSIGSTSIAVAATAPKLLWGDNASAYGAPASTTRMAVYATGSSLNSTQAADEASCITTFLTAVGAS